MRRLFMSAAAAACFASVTLTASAQDTSERVRRAQVKGQQPAGTLTPAVLDEKTTGATFRASELIGTNLQNDQGQSVGEINDLVMDASSGRVRYVAVTYGGFLGVGDKLFAVPFEAFKVRQDPDDADDYVLVLNVTQQQLKGAQGFDEDNWPDMADANWARELDQRYNVQRGRRGVDVDVNRNGVDVDVDRDGVDVDVNRKDRDLRIERN
ncbi:MAG: PRC-barrel domain-containing protein [Planctomycetaceae bacterium]